MKNNLNLTIIAAVSVNGVIGIDDAIPWQIPEDFKHFRKTTMGSVLIIGYNTYKTLPEKAFEGRDYYVLNGGNPFKTDKKNVYQVTSIDELFELLDFNNVGNVKLFVAGGASVYEALIDYCNEAIITLVGKIYPDGNKKFPLVKLITDFELKDSPGWEVSAHGIDYKINYYKRLDA